MAGDLRLSAAHASCVRRVTGAMITAAGWILQLTGLALWLFGYFTSGHPALIDWRALMPWWISDFLPNFETELGVVLMLVSIVPMYWPTRAEGR